MPKTENKTVDVPKRIAFCITELDPGGAERALVNIVTRLDRSKWTPKVYCLGPEAELVAPLREQGIEVVCFGGTKLSVFKAIRWLKRELIEYQPQLLQCFLFHANIMGRLAGKAAGVPIVLSGHRVAEKQKRWHLWVDRMTKNKVDRHVAVSQQVREFVISQLKLAPEEVVTIPNGVDANLTNAQPASDDILRELNVDPTQRFVIAAGRLHPQKGFLDLIEGMQLLRDQLPQTQLLIVGEGPQRQELEQKIKQVGLQNRVTLAGYRDDLTPLMKRAELFVLSSHWEGMSNALLEAMCLGLPIVTTKVEGVSELIQHEESGVIVPAQNATALADGISQVLQNSTLAQRMGEVAEKNVKENFTWEEVAKNYEELFNSLI